MNPDTKDAIILLAAACIIIPLVIWANLWWISHTWN